MTAAQDSYISDWRGWSFIAAGRTGMRDPRVEEWAKEARILSEENNSWSDSAQGVTTDGNAWYLVSNGGKGIRKYDATLDRVTNTILQPSAAERAHSDALHLGAPGYFNGWLYVPLQKPYGVWKVKTDFTSSSWATVIPETKIPAPVCADQIFFLGAT